MSDLEMRQLASDILRVDNVALDHHNAQELAELVEAHKCPEVGQLFIDASNKLRAERDAAQKFESGQVQRAEAQRNAAETRCGLYVMELDELRMERTRLAIECEKLIAERDTARAENERLLRDLVPRVRADNNDGPGTPAARLTELLRELERLFPSVVNPFASDPPEPKLLVAIERLKSENQQLRGLLASALHFLDPADYELEDITNVRGLLSSIEKLLKEPL